MIPLSDATHRQPKVASSCGPTVTRNFHFARDIAFAKRPAADQRAFFEACLRFEGSSMPSLPLRFVVLCDSLDMPLWQANCIKEAVASGAAIPAGVVVRAAQPDPPNDSKWQKRWRNRHLALWRAFNRIYVNRFSKATKSTDMRDFLSDVPTIAVHALKAARRREVFDSETVAFIRNAKPDFILRFGFGILTGEVFDCAKLGVWSYHHGDPTEFRGHPPGFWEILKKSRVAGVVLQVLNDELDGGCILHRGHFKTNLHSYVRTRDALYFGASSWVRRVCADINANGFRLAENSGATQLGPVYKEPTNRDMIKFCFACVKEFAASQKTYKANRQNWNVAVVDAPIHVVAGLEGPEAQTAALSQAHWMPRVSGTFRADPFGYPLNRSGDIRILCELYDWRRHIGSIAAVDYNGGKFGSAKLVLDAPTHLSYPFVLHHNDDICYIPEHSAGRDISAFQVDEQGITTHKATLFPKSQLIDATFYECDDTFWMFSLDESTSKNTDLHIYYSSCLEGPWRAHPLNPVKSDIRSARPGGTPFMHGGKLYRPAQDCSKHYGSSTVISEVKVLSKFDYVEEVVAHVNPLPNGLYPYGLHTVSAVGNKTLIDGARKVSVLRSH
ncbi:formyltransferase family protein [Erythrobacter sp. QSSC1-22B]|uniref:glucosamine inositolphosphorylceramide transferase family protein n=1 Tax=Erythrobacter sp. QSSC1-22B TaxID=1860125 RepID=UPI0009F2BCBA|nr:formyltransferase family protein [Erythrobacter sp. QSSC1-22B]